MSPPVQRPLIQKLPTNHGVITIRWGAGSWGSLSQIRFLEEEAVQEGGELYSQVTFIVPGADGAFALCAGIGGISREDLHWEILFSVCRFAVCPKGKCVD